jgi:regulator of sigma E protease
MYNILYLGAFIAINLAIMNMLPIPALDGGRVFLLLVTVLIQKLTGKKLDPKYEGYVHAAGMVLLLALMAVIMFQDILKLFR